MTSVQPVSMLRPMSKRAPNDPTIAIGYLRVSTEDQGLGLEAQRAAIEAWATKACVTVAAWHVDQGVSGSKPVADRPELLAALASIKKHKAGVFVVAKRDRIARDVAIACVADQLVKEAGASPVSADGVGNGDGPAERFMRTVIDAAAEYERALICARTKAALAEKKRRGERVGSVRYGYRVGEDGKTEVEDAEEQVVIAKIKELREQGHTLRAIVAKLDELEMRSRVGRPFGLAQVDRVWQALKAAA